MRTLECAPPDLMGCDCTGSSLPDRPGPPVAPVVSSRGRAAVASGGSSVAAAARVAPASSCSIAARPSPPPPFLFLMQRVSDLAVTALPDRGI